MKLANSKVTEDPDGLDKHQKMLDGDLNFLKDLKPACVDTGLRFLGSP